jgi:radical SAM protein with 4Fe4S-binding SPASM domain
LTQPIDYKNNKRICSLAWTHLHVTTTGRVAPCGQYVNSKSPDIKLANIQDSSLDECINSSGMKYIRSMMLQNKPNEMCSLCEYKMQQGIESTKDRFNALYLEKTKFAIEATRADGHIDIDDYKPVFFDVRFGNLCNLRCRMCNWEASSAWFDETKEIGKQNLVTFDTIRLDDSSPKFVANGAYDKIEHLLQYAEKMYFAGGEPLLMEEHYRALQYLIDSGKSKDVELHYSTNYTISKYKGKLVADYWKEFKQVIVAGSVDGIEEVSDYIRTGSSWEKMKQVVSEMKPQGDEYNNITLSPCFSVSIMNIFHSPRFFKWCFENGWFEKNLSVIAINYVDYPPDLSIKYLPYAAKKTVEEEYVDLSRWLIENGHPLSAKVVNEIITYMNGGDITQADIDYRMSQAVNRMDVYDKTSHLNWKETLPELKHALLAYIK